MSQPALKLSKSVPLFSSQDTDPTVLFEGRKSIHGKRWLLQEQNPRDTLAISQRFKISDLMASMLLKRGLDIDSAAPFLDPTLRHYMPDPSHLKDMDKGVERLIKALQNKEKIAIFGDYDVDGATSSALLCRYLRDVAYEPKIYIPQRLEEGYGPNTPALQSLKRDGYNLVIMVDCGTTAFEPLTAAAEMGQDIIVVDHHISQAALPPAAAIINPNRLDEDSPLTSLCAAGLAFMFVAAVNRSLRNQGWFQNRPIPDLMGYLDLVALGTVCDVMSLTGLNRAFVAKGLEVMTRRENLGLRALADVAGVYDRPGTYHLGFIIGPRINAGGRVGKADYGARLLSTLDGIEAHHLAQQLNEYNTDRKEIEQFVQEEALHQVESRNLDRHPIIVVGNEGWHPGVIGIVAGRLKEKYHRPVCVVGFDGDMGKGSGRSIHGVNLGNVMHTATHKGLLEYGGGHAMAAGFTVKRDQYDAFYAYLIDQLKEQVNNVDPVLELDAVLTPSGATIELVEEFKRLEPCGTGNYAPKFCMHRARVTYAERIGVNHLRCSLLGEDGSRVKAMAFRSLDTPLGNLLMARNGQYIEVAGTLKVDIWNGRKNVTFFIEDALI